MARRSEVIGTLPIVRDNQFLTSEVTRTFLNRAFDSVRMPGMWFRAVMAEGGTWNAVLDGSDTMDFEAMVIALRNRFALQEWEFELAEWAAIERQLSITARYAEVCERVTEEICRC